MIMRQLVDTAGPSPNDFDGLVDLKRQCREYNRTFRTGNRQAEGIVLSPEGLGTIIGDPALLEVFLSGLQNSEVFEIFVNEHMG